MAEQSDRAEKWASTMAGYAQGGVRRAHDEPPSKVGAPPRRSREEREALEEHGLAPGATRAVGSGRRDEDEPADPVRTCFERDRDRILHDAAFRRLAGKTQVFVFPEDHQRTRLTHALEVEQVATGIARACGLNVALTSAIALGHDCGHGPFGHASEDAFTPFVQGGFDHAVWGADVALSHLNLCVETLDGIRNHSWARPAPGTPEGEAVSWADRIAYVCHDFEDAVRAGIVTPEMLPEIVRKVCGDERRTQLHAFITGVVNAVHETGQVAMTEPEAEALAAFRKFNYDTIYMRPASVAQGESVVRVLRALVDYYADRPNRLPLPDIDDDPRGGLRAGSDQAVREAVAYVAGMTDHFACAQAESLLGWRREDLPVGFDVVR